MKKKKHIAERWMCATVNQRDMDMDIDIRELQRLDGLF